jgi:tetratricopeptide (TPR) repeat protein
LHLQGKVDEAIACYHRAIALAPNQAAAHHNLGLASKAKGKLDEAIACFRTAIALDPKYTQAHYNLGLASRDKGKLDEAIACFHTAIALDPKFVNARGELGLALMRQGQFSEAQKALRRCLALLPPNHPVRGGTSRLLQQCQQLLDAEVELKAFLAGGVAPSDAATLALMAFVAQRPVNRLYLTAVRLYGNAFTRQPRQAEAYRYDAACAAALAGTAQGKDVTRLDDTGKAELRYTALCWLQEHLGAVDVLVAQQPGVAGPVRQSLLHWQKDPDVAAVRDPVALRKLPEAEQAAWRNLWAHVAALLARTKPAR